MTDYKSAYLDGQELQIRAGGLGVFAPAAWEAAHLDYATGQPKAEVQMSLFDGFIAHPLCR